MHPFEIPIIASRKGGLPEIVVDEETGFLVDAESPEQIAERLKQLMTTPDFRAKMGDSARERVLSNFTRSEMIDGVASVLQSIANKA